MEPKPGYITAIDNARAALDAIDAAIARLDCPQHDSELERLRARLAELEAANRWIPVTERLPEDNRDVLALYDGDIIIAWFSKNCWKRDAIEFYERIKGITHWRPLTAGWR